jgi:hypothetical protein
MSKSGILIFWVLSSQISTAQTRPLKPLTMVDVSFISAGITRQAVLGEKFIIDFSGGIGPGYDIAEGSHSVVFLPALYGSVTPRFYYNLSKRVGKGKSTDRNCGNFIGTRVKYSLPVFVDSDQIRNSLLINGFWGLQRPLGAKWIFSGQVGAGYALDTDYNFGTIYPALDFKFAYLIAFGKSRIRE